MRLLLDQGLPRSTVHHLDAAGVESAHVGEKGLATASDAKIIDFAREGGWIVVTLDADFHALLAPNQGLYPALKALGLKQAGMHALRRGCNRRWELAGINPAVLRQQMGHASAAMTALYTGEIPLEHVQAEFSSKIGNQIVVLENMENEAFA